MNRFQTQYILDNIYNDDILTTLGRDDNADNIFGVFLTGDTNNGQLFSRCDFEVTPGNVNADNCDVPQNELNPFDLFAENGFIDGPDITWKAKANEGVKCTSCIDPAQDDFNSLAVDEDGIGFITDPSSTRDLDHILVQDGYCKNYQQVAFAREFLDKIVEIDGDLECPVVTGPGTCAEMCVDVAGSCDEGQLCCSNGWYVSVVYFCLL